MNFLNATKRRMLFLLIMLIGLFEIIVYISETSLSFNVSSLNNRDYDEINPDSLKSIAMLSCDNKPDITYDNPLAVKYTYISMRTNSRKFEKCEQDKVDKQVIFIDYLKMSDENTLEGNESYKIRFNHNYLKNFLNKKALNCFFQYFDKTMGKPDSHQPQLGEKMYFTQDNNFQIIVNQFGFYLFNCDEKSGNKTKVIYNYLYSILPSDMSKLIDKAEPNRIKVENMKKTFNDSKENPMFKDVDLTECDELFNDTNNSCFNQKPNVLILSFDSVSKQHLQRIFPKTYNFLKFKLENNVFFENYHSVGFNTRPNYLPLFAGMIVHPNFLLNTSNEDLFYNKYDKNFHDYFPLIWHEFEKQGYMTMFFEEITWLGLFNYYLNGFRYYPASYYLATLMHKYHEYSGGAFCLKNQDHIYKFSLEKIIDFVYKMNMERNKDINYFSLNMLKYYLHDYFTIPESFDADFANMLMDFEKKGFLENTILIVKSDHGFRLGKYYFETDYGKQENLMPFVSIRLPKSLLNSKYHQNLKNNRFKLITAFDIYKTFKHITYINKYGFLYNFNNDSLIKTEKYEKCQNYFSKSNFKIRSLRGVSLFEDIPSDRACSDALIPFSLCLCNKMIEISQIELLNELKLNASSFEKYIAQLVNDFSKDYRKKCKIFEFEKILQIKKLKSDDENINFSAFDIEASFQPGNASFKVPLIKYFNNDEIQTYDKVERRSLYGKQSNCVPKALQGLCFCH